MQGGVEEGLFFELGSGSPFNNLFLSSSLTCLVDNLDQNVSNIPHRGVVRANSRQHG